MLETCLVPFSWRGIVVPVPKKNNIGIFEVDNFCGITLAPVMYKVMCSVVQERLVEIVEGKQ